MPRHMLKICIRGQHRQLVLDAELRKQRVNRANLYTVASAEILQFSGFDVSLSARHEEWQRGESLQNRVSRGWSGKPLKQLLKNQTGGDNLLFGRERLLKRIELGTARWHAASQGQ